MSRRRWWGGSWSQRMEGLFLDPAATYLRRCRQVRQTCHQLSRVERGYRFIVSWEAHAARLVRVWAELGISAPPLASDCTQCAQ
jgi:hypothetical protein